MIDDLPRSQGGPGRHKCAVCAFIRGFRLGTRWLTDGSISQPDIRKIHPKVDASSRLNLRRSLVKCFVSEAPGSGIGKNATNYHYIVEENLNGHNIRLERPARLRLGFDFLVCADKFNFSKGSRSRNYPSHDEIFKELKRKKRQDRKQYAKLYSWMQKVYLCKVEKIPRVRLFRGRKGIGATLLLGLIKWLFVEQDMHYWNYSGREKLWKSIPRP